MPLTEWRRIDGGRAPDPPQAVHSLMNNATHAVTSSVYCVMRLAVRASRDEEDIHPRARWHAGNRHCCPASKISDARIDANQARLHAYRVEVETRREDRDLKVGPIFTHRGLENGEAALSPWLMDQER
jgi:hypothetical protein